LKFCHVQKMSIEIIGTGRALPPNRVSNNDLSAQIDTDDAWIRSHTGIGFRHIADEKTACSDLAVEAAKNALAMAAGYTGNEQDERDRSAASFAESIDLIILATATPDHYCCPSTACIVQDKLNARNAAAFDLTAGCTGFVYSLETAAGLLSVNPNRKRALVIGSDILSKIVDWDDRATCVLFGDGAGAVVLEKTDTGSEKSGILQSVMHADGTGRKYLIVRRGGTRAPYKKGEVIEIPAYIEMNGQEVYNFAVKAVTDTIAELMKLGNYQVDDIAKIVPHQANARIVQSAARRLKIPLDKFYLNIEEYANTGSASIPLALDEMNRKGMLKKGDIILTVGFGAGLTFGGNIIIWQVNNE
jgi:3-oxoacyl-[acyl-carrier-protein] synthase-3